MGAVLLGDGNGTGVPMPIVLSALLPGRDVGVAVEQDIPRPQRRQGVFMKVVTVGGKNGLVPQGQKAVLRQDGKVQHHLVYLGVAVAPHAQQAVLPLVEQGDDLFGGIVPGQIVPGAVVEQVAQKQEPVRSLPVKGFQQFLQKYADP